MIKVSPSILSADFANLERDIRKVDEAGADYIHVDVMDGLFVPNITIGAPVVKAIRKTTDKVLDVHLMIDRPVRYVEDFAKAGSDIITVHYEADTPENVVETLKKIRSLGCRAGISIKPKTPADVLFDVVGLADLILVMTVEPGFGGQSFIEDTVPKISRLRELIEKENPDCELEVDGGINSKTAVTAKSAGANVLVAGSALFGNADIPRFIAELKEV